MCDIGVFGQGGRGWDWGKGGRDDLFEHTHSSPLLFLILSCSLISWTDRLTRGALVTGSGRKSTTRSHDDDGSRGPDGVSRERGGVKVKGRKRGLVCVGFGWFIHMGGKYHGRRIVISLLIVFHFWPLIYGHGQVGLPLLAGLRFFFLTPSLVFAFSFFALSPGGASGELAARGRPAGARRPNRRRLG